MLGGAVDRGAARIDLEVDAVAGEAEVTLISEEPCEPYERPPPIITMLRMCQEAQARSAISMSSI